MRDVKFDSQAREALTNGVNVISKAVGSTLGPRGKTVIIESQNHTNGLTVTKDGVTVAKSISLEDAVENLAVQIVRNASERTALEAGDGTTTSIVIAESLCNDGLEASSAGMNMSRVTENVRQFVSEIIKELKEISREVHEDTLENIATISANNDKAVGKIIADAYIQVGLGGLVTVENSMSEKTYSDITKGVKVDRGFTSRLFINNQKKDECVLENVYILMTDIEINSLLQLEEVLKHIALNRKPLLIVAPMSTGAVNALASNVIKNRLPLVNINPPGFGYKSQELMSDLAAVTGGVYFSQQAGDDLSLIGVEDLGFAKKVTINQDSTIIVTEEETTEEIGQRIVELMGQLDEAKKESDKKFIQERISYLKGAIGVIYVGGSSDVEQKELYDRVDDAVCAVRSALEEGIIPGGGIALMRAAKKAIMVEQDVIDEWPEDKQEAYYMVINAVTAPFKKLLTNADYDNEQIIDMIKFVFNHKFDYSGYDLKEERWVNMYEAGIIDPLKVTKNALINAVSVATTLINTNAVITYKREEK